MRKRFFLSFVFLGFLKVVFGQCPNTQLFNLDLTVASSEPEWINCIDNSSDPDNFNLELISPENIENYTVDWGDGSPLESGVIWSGGDVVSHNYTDLGMFTVTLTEIQNGCSNTITGTFISDRKPGATAQPPTNNASGCVPHSLSFVNQSTNISQFTVFEWDWGDGTTTVVNNFTDPGAVGVPISHEFLSGVSGCGMSVQLTARSLCDTSFVIYGPYDFYDIDTTAVGASNFQLCVGDTVTFTDQTQYNCIPGTRRIRWDLSDFGGGITDWVPATPGNRVQDFFIDGPVGSTFDIELQDSNFCGVNESVVSVEIIAPPVAIPSVVNDSICEGDNAQLLNTSTGVANVYLWTFGDGNDFSVSSTSQVNHVYSDSGSYEVQLIADVAGSLQCRDTATVELYVKPSPNISFSTSVDRGCDTLESELVNTTEGLINWSWDLGSGEEGVNEDTINVAFEDKGFYVVTLLGENDFLCEATVTDTLLVVPEPTISFNDDSLCFEEEYVTVNRTSLNEFPTGSLIVDRYLGLNNSNSIDDLLNDANYPNAPIENFIVNEFDIPNSVVSNAGDRVQAFIKPEISGLYKFFVSGDDDASLYLSTDENPVNKVEIASVPSFTSYQEWGKHASQQSDFIQLDSGVYYYIEAVGKSFTGGFHLSVGWQLPDGQLERPIQGNYLTPYFEGLTVKDWEWDFGDGSPLINTKDTTHIFSGSGDFTVTLTASTGVCSSTDSIEVSVAGEIDSNLVFLDTAGCSPLELSVIDSSNVISLDYVFGDGEAESISHVLGDTVNHTYFNNGEDSRFFSFSAILTTDFGCNEDVFQTIEVFPTPGSDLVLDMPAPPCAPFNLNVYNEDFDNTWTYEWRYGDSVITGDSSITVAIDNQSSSLRFDTLSLLVQNETSCESYVEEIFSVFPEPNYSLTVEPDSGCSTLEVGFTLNETSQTYLWDFGDGSFSTESSPTHEYSVVSQDSITYFPIVYLLSPFSCRDTLSSSVFVQKSIQANFIASPVSQTYPDTTINILSLNSGPVVDTIWSIGDSLISGDLTSFNFDTVGIHIISQTVQNEFCSDVYVDTIIILPPVPIVGFDGGGTACVNTEFEFMNTSLYATDFLWDFGDGNTSFEESPRHVYDSVGVFDVQLIASGLGGLDSVTQIGVVSIIESPISALTVFNDTVYQPDSIFNFLDVSSEVVISKTWMSGNGDTLTDLSNSVDFKYEATGTYTGSLIIETSVENCIDTSFIDVVLLPPLPRVSFSGADTSCAPLTIDFENTSENALFYRWDFGDGTESFERNPSHTYDSVGVYNVKLVAINLQGEDSLVSSGGIQVLANPVASFTPVSDSLIYPDTVFSIINNSSGDITLNQWGYNSTIDSVSGLIGVEVALDQFGENILTLTVSNDFENCSSEFSDTLFVESPLPIADFFGEGSGCMPVEVQFTNNSQYGETYFWDFGDGSFSREENPTYTYIASGTYHVTLVVGNLTGSDSITKTNIVEVYNNPSALFFTNPSPDLELVAPVDVFFNNQSLNSSEYIWDFGDGLSSSDEKPLHQYSEEGEYVTSLVALSEFGCRDTFELETPIVVMKGGLFVVPNAFSPNPDQASSNGDITEGLNNNDIFFPKIKGDVVEYKLFIYDRWGELLFLSEDPEIGWDGYYEGRLSKQDVYVYRLEIQFETGESDILIGDFSLIR